MIAEGEGTEHEARWKEEVKDADKDRAFMEQGERRGLEKGAEKVDGKRFDDGGWPVGVRTMLFSTRQCSCTLSSCPAM